VKLAIADRLPHSLDRIDVALDWALIVVRGEVYGAVASIAKANSTHFVS
jgi:hypothetical protein